MIALALPLLLALAVQPTPPPGPASPAATASAAPAPSPPPGASPAVPPPTIGSPVPPSASPMHLRGFMGKQTGKGLPVPLATVGPANATYVYRFVPGQPTHPATDQPQIFAVYLNAKALHSQGPIDIRVITSANVVKVTSSSNGRAGLVSEIGPGDFQAHSKLPKLPRIVTGITTTLDFTAVSPTGKKITVGVPIQLQ